MHTVYWNHFYPFWFLIGTLSTLSFYTVTPCTKSTPLLDIFKYQALLIGTKWRMTGRFAFHDISHVHWFCSLRFYTVTPCTKCTPLLDIFKYQALLIGTIWRMLIKFYVRLNCSKNIYIFISINMPKIASEHTCIFSATLSQGQIGWFSQF